MANQPHLHVSFNQFGFCRVSVLPRNDDRVLSPDFPIDPVATTWGRSADAVCEYLPDFVYRHCLGDLFVMPQPGTERITEQDVVQKIPGGVYMHELDKAATARLSLMIRVAAYYTSHTGATPGRIMRFLACDANDQTVLGLVFAAGGIMQAVEALASTHIDTDADNTAS